MKPQNEEVMLKTLITELIIKLLRKKAIYIIVY